MLNDNKKAMISDFIVIAKADDVITQPEYDFMYRLAERMDVTKEEVNALIDNPHPSQPIFTELERITHFHKLVLLMNVDRETHDKEVVVLRNFGLKMGIHPSVIDVILVEMNQHEDKIIPSHRLIEIFKSFYN